MLNNVLVYWVLAKLTRGTSFDVTTQPNLRYPQRASSGPVYTTGPRKPLVDNCPEPRERCVLVHRVPLGVGWGHWHPPHHCHVPHGTDGHEPGTHGSRHPPQVPKGCLSQPWPGRGPVSTRQHLFLAGAWGCRRVYSLLDGNDCTMHPMWPTWPVMSFRAKFLLSPIFFSSSLVVLEGATASVPPNGCRNKCRGVRGI